MKIDQAENPIQLSDEALLMEWRALGTDPLRTNEGKQLFLTLGQQYSLSLLIGISGGLPCELEKADGTIISIPGRITF